MDAGVACAASLRRWKRVKDLEATGVIRGYTALIADIKAYEQFLHDTSFKPPGVTHVRSSIVLKEVEQETQLPGAGAALVVAALARPKRRR